VRSVDNAERSIQTHLVVTPARNEAENIRRLADCLVAQTWLPNRWVVVDNGSTDGTQEIVRELGHSHNWIHLISIPSDSDPTRGRSSVRAFNSGVMGERSLGDLITGLDADISFEPNYFDSIRRKFECNTRLGIAAGLCYERHGDRWRPVHVTHPNLRGAALTYRQQCLAELLPLEARHGGWEAISIVRARTRGWDTALIKDLGFRHHRPTGTRDLSRFTSYAEEGDGAYYMWYRPSYLLLRTLYRTLRSRNLAATGLAWGYTRAALRGAPRHTEPALRDFMRSNQSPKNWLVRARESAGRR